MQKDVLRLTFFLKEGMRYIELFLHRSMFFLKGFHHLVEIVLSDQYAFFEGPGFLQARPLLF